MSTATLPDELSPAAREFAAGPHRLLIGGEPVAAADGATLTTVDPSTAPTSPRVAIETARSATVAGSVMTASGSVRGTSVPSLRYARSAKASAIGSIPSESAMASSGDPGGPSTASDGSYSWAAATTASACAGWVTQA